MALKIELSGDRAIARDGDTKIAEMELVVAKNYDNKKLKKLWGPKSVGFGGTDPGDPKIQKFIDSLSMPDKFTYIWIDKLKVLPKLRGQGYGHKIISELEKKYSPLVISLNPGEISTGQNKSSISDILTFYKQVGFKITKDSEGSYIAFRIS